MDNFKKDLLKIVKDSIKEFKKDSIILKNGIEIKPNKIISSPSGCKLEKIDYTKKGLIISNGKYSLFGLFNKYPILEEKILNLIRNAIKNVNENTIFLKNDVEIQSKFENPYALIRKTVLCFQSLAYCCKPEKRDCLRRDRVLEVFSISKEEFIQLKEEFEQKISEFVKKKSPNLF